jgi:hypothetical protein
MAAQAQLLSLIKEFVGLLGREEVPTLYMIIMTQQAWIRCA